MKKIFTLAAAVLASLTMMAQTEIFSFTATSSTTAIGTYPATNGSAVLSGGAHATGGNNEITVDDQTYYKFNSSTKWTFTLTEGTFAVDDVISLKGACATSDKSGKGFKLAGSIVVTGNFPKNAANTLTYTIKENDGIAGKSSFTLERNDSDIKFGTITITRPAAETNPVAKVTITGSAMGVVNTKASFSATTDVKADEYEWFVNGNTLPGGSNSKTMEFTPMAAGTYSVVCKARNANNATDQWAADTVAFKVYSTICGEIIKATLTSGSAATVTGIVGGTADVSLSSSKKMDKGKYCGITLANGTFQEGDTVIIAMTTAGSNYPCLFGDKAKTKLLYLATETSSALEYKIVLPAEANGLTSLYLVRDGDDATYKWNPVLSSISVIRPVPVDHADVALVGVAIDGESLPSDFVTHLINEGTFTILTSYVNAPVVAFVKHTDTYYEGETEPVSTNDSIKVTATDVEGKWQAQATIGENTYTITLAKASSFTVHYMDGTTELGTENVAVNGTVAEYAKYQSKSLYSFVGWYTEEDLTNPANLEAQITAETYLYAKFEEKYATSINIEKAVMENGKGYAIINQLGALGYASNITGSLDSLDNSKDQRNYAYLGLKVKQNGALLNFRLEAGKTVTIKFGEIKKTPNVSINGGEYAGMTITDKVYTHTAEANELISIKMMDGNAVVFQQIMIGEDLQAPALFAINCAEAQNGSVDAPFTLGIPGEKITLTVTPAEGYKIENVTLNGETVEAVEGAYSFTMPDAAAAVSATFVKDTASALGNTEAEAKAMKVVRDGQLLILKNGVLYNAQGAIVK